MIRKQEPRPISGIVRTESYNVLALHSTANDRARGIRA
jgi:hypothetical protein